MYHRNLIFSIKPQIFELKCVFSYFRLKTHITLLLPVYVHSWEQRKLNEVVNVYDGVHQTPDYKDSGVMFLSVENISTLKSEKYISEEAFQRDYKVYPQKGDILMTRIGDVGTPNVVEATEKVAFYVSLALLKPTKINSYFLCNSIQSPLFQKGLKDRTLVTAIPQKINKDEIGKVNIILPTSSQEQQLIGDYFRNLDNLITLHQCKCQIDGCRFQSPLAITWEQRKLGDVVDVRSGKDYKHLSEGNIPVYGTGGFMLSVNQALSYDEDAIGIGRKGTIDKPYILKAPFWTVDTLFYAIPREKVDLNFAFDVFQNIDWKKKDESTGVPSLSKTAINEIDVLVPQYDEQQPLGQFFNRIDNLITLHQCE